MFKFLFPIFCSRLVVTRIVVKGLVTAADTATSHKKSPGRWNAESGRARIPAASSFSRSPILPSLDRFGRGLDRNAVNGVDRKQLKVEDQLDDKK